MKFFEKIKDGNKRTIKLFGFKFSYKKKIKYEHAHDRCYKAAKTICCNHRQNDNTQNIDCNNISLCKTNNIKQVAHECCKKQYQNTDTDIPDRYDVFCFHVRFLCHFIFFHIH